MRAMMMTMVAAAALIAAAPARADDADVAIAKALASLAKAQQSDGVFAGEHPVAVTAIAGLAILAGDDDALSNETLRRAARFLIEAQRDGDFVLNGESYWVHTQGFATLFAAELLGRVMAARERPKELDEDKLRTIVSRATKLLAAAQSTTGGWDYGKIAGAGDEGSTTVCAVQALRAARNFGIEVDQAVLDRGFAYLKRMQNPDGGFRYQGGAGGSMTAGTAGATATLVLMQRLDERVLLRAVAFLEGRKVEGLARESCARYALFYAAMAMKVIDEEFGKHKPDVAAFLVKIETAVAREQQSDGSWAGDASVRSPSYGTAMAALALACRKGRLSVFHRDAPKAKR